MDEYADATKAFSDAVDKLRMANSRRGFEEVLGPKGDRVSLQELAEMQERGWVRRVSPGSGRCDHWEITDAGREALGG